MRCIFAFAAVVALASGLELLFTDATLQSGNGGFDQCPTPNASTCVNGLAAAVARRRRIEAESDRTIMFAAVDRTSVFVKLHPLDWGVNYDVLHRFNITAMIARAVFVTPNTRVAFQAHEKRAVMLDNVNFPSGHPLRPDTSSVLLDKATGVQLVSVRAAYRGIDDAVSIAVRVLNDAATVGKDTVRQTILLTHDADPAQVLAKITAVRPQPPRPAAIIAMFNSTNPGATLVNGSWIVRFNAEAAALHRVQLTTNAQGALSHVAVVRESLALDDATKQSPEYLADQAFLRTEAVASATNDPVLCQTAAMPSVSTSAGKATCIAGECAMGNLWTDALLHATKADVTFFPGAWLGGGWSAGPLRRLQVYDAFGYTNQICQATVLGVTLFELLNEVIGSNSFNPDGDPNTNPADSFLPQVAGARIKYNKARAGDDRLVSIEVFNTTTRQYRPLQRSKLYTVGGVSYMCDAWRPYFTYLSGRYRGESKSVTDAEADLHRAVEAFLLPWNTSAAPYAPGTSGRLVDDPTATVSMASTWKQTSSSCGQTEFFDAAVNSCVSCASGFHNPTKSAACVAIPPPQSSSLSTGTLTIIVAAAVFVIIVIGAVSIVAYNAWRKHALTRFCPTDTSLPFAACFVTIRNEVAMRERHPVAADAALQRIATIVSKSAANHGCYVAQRLDAHVLLVGKDVARLTECACDVLRSIEQQSWSSFIAEHTSGSACGTPRLRYAMKKGHSEAGRVTLMESDTGSVSTISLGSGRGGGTFSRTGTTNTSTVHAMRTGHSPGSSSRGGGRGRIVAPRASIGLAFGVGRIMFDELEGNYRYRGAVVDTAAAVADSARPGQFLTTEAASEAAKANTEACEFDEFCVRTMPDGTDLLLLQVNLQGTAARDFAVHEDGIDEDGVAGALTAALETAAGGLTSRRVAAVAVTAPKLRDATAFASRTDQAQHCESLYRAAQTAAAPHDVVAAIDGTLTVVINAAAVRTAQIVTSAVHIARDIVSSVESATGLAVHAGVATGPSLVGLCNGAVVSVGVVGERARLLAFAAAAHESDPKVLVAPELISEVEAHFDAVAVELLAWPKHCLIPRAASDSKRIAKPRETLKKKRSQSVPDGQSPGSGQDGTPSSGSGGGSSNKSTEGDLALVFSVEREKQMMADDEWLYQLESAIAKNPYSETNTAFLRAVSFVAPDATPSYHGLNSPSTCAIPTPLSSPHHASDEVGALSRENLAADRPPGLSLPAVAEDTTESRVSAFSTHRIAAVHRTLSGATTPQQRRLRLGLFAERRTVELCMPFVFGPREAKQDPVQQFHAPSETVQSVH